MQYWYETVTPGEFAFEVLRNVATVAGLAWIASTSKNPTVVPTVAVGVMFMVAWRAGIFQLGRLIVVANVQGVLELEMISPSPIALIVFGKVLAATVFYGLIGVLAFFMVLAIGGETLHIAYPVQFVVSLVIAFLAVIVVSFLFAPLTFLVGGRSGFFNAIIPVGIVLSGFVQPIDLLPPVIEGVARLLNTSWAMEALFAALAGNGSALRIVGNWGVSLVLSGVLFLLTVSFFHKAETRIRRLGNLDTM